MTGTDEKPLSLSVHERIEKLAYLLWEVAGRHHGMSLDFWLAAEREILKNAAGLSEAADGDEATRQTPAKEPLPEPAPVSDDTPPAPR